MWQSSSPGSLTLLLSTRVPFPNKISCFVSTCVSLDNSFPSARQEPSFGPWKGSSFLQQHQIYHFTANRWGKMETGIDFIFLGSKITVDSDFSHEIKRCLFLGRKAVINLDSVFKKQRYYFADKGSYSQMHSFSSSHVWMLTIGS